MSKKLSLLASFGPVPVYLHPLVKCLSNFVKESFILDQVERYKGTGLKFSSYFSDLLEFLVKIDQGTEAHRYRVKNLPEMEHF